MNAVAANPTALPPLEGRGSSWSRFTGLFAHNHLGNLLFIVTVVIGFFHGWLKLRYRGVLPTFAFDIPQTVLPATRQMAKACPRRFRLWRDRRSCLVPPINRSTLC